MICTPHSSRRPTHRVIPTLVTSYYIILYYLVLYTYVINIGISYVHEIVEIVIAVNRVVRKNKQFGIPKAYHMYTNQSHFMYTYT